MKNMTSNKWVIDTTHSEVEFKVKHLMITNTTGKFKNFEATVEAQDDDFTKSKISFSASIDSIDTRDESRDNHLKGEDFFNSEKFPKISFESTSFTHKDGDHYALTGNLTIRDITRPITLDVEFGGITKDPWGQTKAGFTVKGKLSRSAYGLKWNAITESGGVVVSDEVRVNVEAQFVKAQVAEQVEAA
jgi:polyisoprenoid-binding protein YceI